MDQIVRYSHLTMTLYIFMGIFIAVWLKQTYYSNNKIINTTLNIRLLILWLILVIFAAIRLINANHVGGTDAYNYELAFLEPIYRDRYKDTDILFGMYLNIISSVTSDSIIYKFISYGIIFGAYILVIKRYCNNKISYIPFVLLIFPYLRSFNTMRNSMSIAIFLLGVLLIANKRDVFGIIIILCSILVHRMTVLYALFIPFYYIFKNQDLSSNKKFIKYIILLVIIGYMSSKVIQSYVIVAQALSNNNNSADLYYISKTLNQGVFSYIPMLFQHIILFLALILFNERLPNTRDMQFIRVIIMFDIIILPCSLVLGMWRSLEYLYIFRIIMWGYLIKCIRKYFNANSISIVTKLISCIFIFWLYFRIDHEWKDAGLMPYIPFFLS